MKTIDAQNKIIGRVATEAAMALMGKDKADYQPNKKPTEKVEIINASKAKIAIKKLDQKVYKRYTGYPGGLKEQTLQELIDKKGYKEVFKKAIYGMLPNNKLRVIMLKNLTIKE